MESKRLPKTIEFNRPAKYKALRRLGAGACGETVLIHDENMDCHFVAKKYSPIFLKDESPQEFTELLERFNEEARILFRLNHPNIVRVYSYYDYKESFTAYILMEFIDGENIIEFSRTRPDLLGGLFEKIIDGFCHLEIKNILHRDIRPQNIIIERGGNPKIIDFGFGKNIDNLSNNAEKSISLNWWCDVPPEFSDSIYDFQTEIYFVGKLFEKIIIEENLSDFKYKKMIKTMTEQDRSKRYSKFSDIKNDITTGQFEDLSFSESEKLVYRRFSSELCAVVSTLDPSETFERDHNAILQGLISIYRQSMLEIYIPNPNKIVSQFTKSSFRYWKNNQFKTKTLHDFIEVIKSMPPGKQSIILDNLITKLDSMERTKPSNLDDDIPF